MRFLITLSVLGVLTAACSPAPTAAERAPDSAAQSQPETQAAAPARAARELFADFQSFLLAEDPILAGREGDREALGRLPSLTPADQMRRKAALEGFQERTAQLSARGGLSGQDAVSLGLLHYVVERELNSIRFDETRMPFNNDSGFHTVLSYLANSTVIRTEDDAEALLERFRDLPRFYDENIANMRRGLETGFVQPQLVVERAIAIVEAGLVDQPAEHSFYRPFATLPETIPLEVRIDLQARALETLSREVGGAQERLLAFFKDEYLPQARTTLAAAELPGGREWYMELVRYHTTDPAATPEDIHRVGLEEVARIRAEMDAIIEETGFEGSFAEFLQYLRTGDRFYARTEEDLLKEAAWIAKRADDQMPRFFRRLPRLPYGVRPVPADIAPAYTTGRYWSGDPDNGRAGGYMVNTYDLRARPLYELPALTLHEAVPGHHHQSALAQELGEAPAFRSDLYVTAFGEGWALYAEKLGLEMGIYRTPYERFGQLSYEMWRACRLVVDTGIHWMGWSREQAEACFIENSALSRQNIVTEVDRYISWPGQALAYKTGEMKIIELRRKAETALGEAFDLAAFHDALLENGGVTLAMLEEHMEKWLGSQLP